MSSNMHLETILWLNKQIDDDLGISMKTVEANSANIMEKLSANTVADLLKIALGQSNPKA